MKIVFALLPSTNQRCPLTEQRATLQDCHFCIHRTARGMEISENDIHAYYAAECSYEKGEGNGHTESEDNQRGRRRPHPNGSDSGEHFRLARRYPRR